MRSYGDGSKIDEVEIDPEQTFQLSKGLFYGTSLLTASFVIAEIQIFRLLMAANFIFALAMSSSVLSNVWEMRGDWRRALTVLTTVLWAIGILTVGSSLLLL
ncbi:MAG: hypothetical protein BRC29_05415 [Nanohaloarchaea archaeon SW_7_43_1]|nr:MAG: hypothetical protein BRC29_05415 [Nanohaloarchaea archaeon SW_7_43_1]